MKLSTWAKKQGISYLTAWRWCHDGKMPVPWQKTPSGSILVLEDGNCPRTDLKTYIYARVSSATKKSDLQRQENRCKAFAEANGWVVERSFTEIASGMNDNRRQLHKLFDLPPGRLIVEHKDRLTRFGFRYLEVLLGKLGWEIIVVNRDEDDKDDLMKDLVSIITSFCCRLYGMRRGHKKAQDLRKQCEDPAS